MPTPLYDALVDKVRDWSNKPEVNTIPDSVIEDCLGYSADECYRTLRIPPLEATVTYTVEAGDNVGDASAGLPYGNAYTCFDIPEDLIQFNYIRTVNSNDTNASKVFNEITDSRTFFDVYSEKYSLYNWMWKEGKIFVHPQLAVGAILEISYYRRLPALNATYSVIPVNYLVSLADNAQPYLTLTGVNTDTPLYFSTLNSVTEVFSTSGAATAYATPVTTKYYVGKEVSNWLRDENERLLIWGALYNLGSYLFDDKMEQRYEKKFAENVFSLNKEEKWRRASGGNVQMNFNTNGLI